jgi:hypothetical protein
VGATSKYTINWVNAREGEKLYQVVVELPILETVLETIRDSIPYMNAKLAEEGSQQVLNSDPSLFELYKSKKTGYPKLDYPGRIRMLNNF